jgi:sulfonate transport system substrate-binding protein
MQRRTLLQLAAASAALAAVPKIAGAAPMKELRLDYAYYSPTSLVLRRFGWLEEALKDDATSVKWVLSAGSNRALEYTSPAARCGYCSGLPAARRSASGLAPPSR